MGAHSATEDEIESLERASAITFLVPLMQWKVGWKSSRKSFHLDTLVLKGQIAMVSIGIDFFNTIQHVMVFFKRFHYGKYFFLANSIVVLSFAFFLE